MWIFDVVPGSMKPSSGPGINGIMVTEIIAVSAYDRCNYLVKIQ